MQKLLYVVLLATASLISTHAAAQWSPSASLDLGFGFGQMALSQAALDGARRLDDESNEAFESEAQDWTEPEFEPSFVADPDLTRIVEERFILFYGGRDPAHQAVMAKEVASGRYHDHFRELMGAYGLDPQLDNFLDVMATRYVKLWEIIHGKAVTPAQTGAVRAQLLAQFGDDFWMRRMDDAEKQELAETFVLHISAADIAHTALMEGEDPELISRYRTGVQENLLPDGPPLGQFEITSAGFVRP